MLNMKEVVIIGDGFAAAVLVTHLLRRGISSSDITVIGSGVLGKGNAYSCNNPFFRLNVREDLQGFAMSKHSFQHFLCQNTVSFIIHNLGLVAQSVEQRIENPCVGGSIPPRATKNQKESF